MFLFSIEDGYQRNLHENTRDMIHKNDEKSCPLNFEDWTSSSRFCYKIFLEKINWTEADHRCQNLAEI